MSSSKQKMASLLNPVSCRTRLCPKDSVEQTGWRVLHVLSTSIPYANGYTYRSKYIVNTQLDDDRYEEVSVVTSPFYPQSDLPAQNMVIGGVSHYRIPHPIDRPCSERRLVDSICVWLYQCRRRGQKPNTPFATGDAGSPPPTKQAKRGSILRCGMGYVWCTVIRPILHAMEDRLLLRIFQRDLDRLVVRLQPDIIHAHSPYRCALPAEAVGHKRGIPCVYEVRGLWEESSVASGRWSKRSPEYRRWRAKETRAMRQADATICICEGLRQELVTRGVVADRILVVPNAASPETFIAKDGQEPPPEIERLRQRLGPMVMGYVGSLRPLEGVNELIRAAAEVRCRGYDTKVLIVGDGVSRPELQRLAEELGLGDHAIFTGRVAHEEVLYYYMLISCFVISRPRTRVTQVVTPLKPLEAMAMERPIIVSDLPALRELVQDEQTGLVYPPGDSAALAEQCIRVFENPEDTRQRTRKARQWLSQHRTWKHVMNRVPEFYAMACSSKVTAGTD